MGFLKSILIIEKASCLYEIQKWSSNAGFANIWDHQKVVAGRSKQVVAKSKFHLNLMCVFINIFL